MVSINLPMSVVQQEFYSFVIVVFVCAATLIYEAPNQQVAHQHVKCNFSILLCFQNISSQKYTVFIKPVSLVAAAFFRKF